MYAHMHMLNQLQVNPTSKKCLWIQISEFAGQNYFGDTEYFLVLQKLMSLYITGNRL